MLVVRDRVGMAHMRHLSAPYLSLVIRLSFPIDLGSVGVCPLVSTRQDMGRTLKGGLAHKIKACTTLVDMHRKILYSTK